MLDHVRHDLAGQQHRVVDAAVQEMRQLAPYVLPRQRGRLSAPRKIGVRHSLGFTFDSVAQKIFFGGHYRLLAPSLMA